MEFVGYPGEPIDRAPENAASLASYTLQYSIGDVTDATSWVTLMTGSEQGQAVMADFEGHMNEWAKTIVDDAVKKCTATEAPKTEAPKTEAPKTSPSSNSESSANRFILPLSIFAILAFAQI